MTAYHGATVLADGNWHQISVTGFNMSSAYDTGAATLYFQTVPPSGNDLVSFSGLKFEVSQKPGQGETSVLILTATNGDVGPAYDTQVTGLSLQQIFGIPCMPVVTPSGSLPQLLGDIPASGSASATFNVDLSRCKSFTSLLVIAPWNSSTYHTGTVRSQVDFVEERKNQGRP